ALTLTATNLDGRSWALSGAPLVAPGTYIVRVVVTDDLAGTGFADTSLVVNPEDAVPTFTGSMLVWTESISSGNAYVPLRATIQDITAASPASDGNPGDI